MKFESIEFAKSVQNGIGVGTPLVVLRLIHPDDFSRGIGEDRSRDGKSRCFSRDPAMEALLAESETVGHVELRIGEKGGAQAMLGMPPAQLARRVGAHGDDSNAPGIELGPKFFPSP